MGRFRCDFAIISRLHDPVTPVVCSVNAQASVPNRFGSSVVFAQGNFYIIGGRDANNEVSVLLASGMSDSMRLLLLCVVWPLSYLVRTHQLTDSVVSFNFENRTWQREVRCLSAVELVRVGFHTDRRCQRDYNVHARSQ